MLIWWLSVVGLGLLLLGWLGALRNVLRRADQPPEFTLDGRHPPDPLPDPPPSLSIVIPARNEAHNIEAAVRSALAVVWPGRLQVVVVDDRSTDGTGEILARLAAEDPRLVVIGGADPPKGWLGKPHALHLAQQRADGDWLLFVDADVRLAPDGPARLVGRAILQGAQMASGLGRLTVETFWERVVQTRMGAVIAGGNPLAKVNDPDREDVMANGQCLLFSRAAYDAMGGHEGIRGSVLDDVDFARKAKAQRVPYRLYFAPDVFACRMYSGLTEIWHGWTKNLFPALKYSLATTAFVTFFMFATSLLPFVLLLKNAALAAMGHPVDPTLVALEGALCVVILAVDGIGHRVNGYRADLFWTFPLGMSLIILLFWNSAWRIRTGRGAVWKGRVVEGRGA